MTLANSVVISGSYCQSGMRVPEILIIPFPDILITPVPDILTVLS